MSKYLFIVTELQSANGICTRAVMEELTKRGHSVFCLTNDVPGKGKTFFDKGITFYTVRPRWLYLFQQYLSTQKDSTFKRVAKIIYIILNKLKLILSYFSWPLISPAYSYRYYKMAMQIYSLYNVDYLVPIYSQIDTLIACHLIKRKIIRIKYIPYMLDPLAAGNGPRFLSKNWTIKRGLRWERLLFSNADSVLMMESCRTFYKKHDTINFRVFFTGLPLLKKIESEVRFREFNEEDINIAYVGSIPQHIRSPKHIIDVLSKIDNKNIVLYFIGPIDNEYIRIKALEDNRIKVFPPISHEDSLSAISSADILLNLGNKLSTMVPSKIFELMSTGLPIVSVTQINDDSCRPYFIKYPNILMLDESGSDDTDAIKLMDFVARYKGKKLPLDIIVNLFKTNTPEYTANILTTTCSDLKETCL